MPKFTILNYNNAKTIKGEAYNHATFLFYGAPAKVSGYNACANSGLCADTCIYYQGMGRFPNVQNARIRKTKLYFEDRDNFLMTVNKDIMKAVTWSKKQNLTPCFRLDGTTDIGIARHFVEYYKTLQFYDYTKILNRIEKAQNIPNWHLTYSLSERTTPQQLQQVLATKTNIAIPFATAPDMTSKLWGRELVNADKHDLRFLDGENKIAVLKVKGKIKSNDFIVPNVEWLKNKYGMEQ
jgi:hypothetical protein